MLKHKKKKNDKGIVLIVVILLITVLALLGLAANRNVITDILISSNHLSSVKAFNASEGGAQYGFNKLWGQLQTLNPNVAGITPPTISGCTIASASYVSAIGGIDTRPTTGLLAGLTAFIQRYRVTSAATDTGNNATGKVVLEVEDQLIPIFQFGIFYQNDLEISPGAPMTYTGGRIHSNSDMYLTANTGSTLSIDSRITSAGNIYKYDEAGRAQNGTVRIKDAAGAYQTLDIDSTTADWATLSQSRWNGRVMNRVHGINSINMPLPPNGQTIDILGTGSNSLYAKAGLRIINGVAKDKDGNTIDLTYYDATQNDGHGHLIIDPGATSLKNVNPISTATSDPTFKDGREDKTMTAVQVDVAKLENSPTARTALSTPPSGGDAGILYISSSNITNPAVRLINGGTLDSSKLPAGLSVATNNPLYVKGDYNTANNKPAAFYADALTVLSGNWDDSDSTHGISDRTANNTTVNAAVMVGNRATNGTDYSGGVENFIRFLENWSGMTFTYSGSLICLWQSQQATHKWPGTGSVYNPPNRVWSFGMNPNSLPPGTPRVRNIVRLGWRQVTN